MATRLAARGHSMPEEMAIGEASREDKDCSLWWDSHLGPSVLFVSLETFALREAPWAAS